MIKLKHYDDNQLVEKFTDGCVDSMEVLVSRHKNRIFTYILLIVKNRDIADDIFQDTFIKIIKSLKAGKYVENGKFISWALRIAHNLIIDFYRKQKGQNTVSNDDREIDLFNSTRFFDGTVEDQIIQTQILEHVSELIHLLPVEQKEVVEMRFYMDLSFKDIAEQTNVSINTALGRMRYAILNLRKLVKENNISLTA